jgi:hypothetical protein
MHFAQTLSSFGVPETKTRTRLMFGIQRRLVIFFHQVTLWPNPVHLPHK